MVKIKLHDKDSDMVEIYTENRGKDPSGNYILWGVVHIDILQYMDGVSTFDLDEMVYELLAEPTNK